MPGFELCPPTCRVPWDWLLNLSVPLLPNLSYEVAVMVKPENTCAVLDDVGVLEKDFLAAAAVIVMSL